MMSFEDLVRRSGDSVLSSITFDGRSLCLRLELEDDETATVIIPASSVQSDLPSSEDQILRTCRMEVLELSSRLDQLNGYFVPPSEFAMLMKNKKDGVSLGYGMKTENARYLVSAIGYSRLVSCVVADLDEINVKI